MLDILLTHLTLRCLLRPWATVIPAPGHCYSHGSWECEREGVGEEEVMSLMGGVLRVREPGQQPPPLSLGSQLRAQT